MAQTIELPHVGESVVEGTIGKWLKQPGDQIERFEPLVEVVTDKVTMEVPSPVDGQLVKILADEGETIPMGAPIAEVEPAEGQEAPAAQKSPEAKADHGESAKESGREPDAARSTPSAGRIGYLNTSAVMVGPTGGGAGEAVSPEIAPATALAQPPEEREGSQPLPTPAGQEAPPSAPETGATPRLSPAVRRLAREHNVDLSNIAGTGMGGRITRDDVLKHLETRQTGAPAVPIPASVTPESSQSGGEDEEYLPITPVRRMIAEAMVRSVSQIPHAWSMVEVDVTGLVGARNAARAAFRHREGVDLTFLPYIVQALVATLRENPTFNASWGDDKIILKNRVNIGLAVAAPNGLVVPVIHNADRLSLSGLAHAVADLSLRAREGRLTIEDVQGGTFTLNNTGALGSVTSQPIINHPQAAILTTEAIQKRPVVINDAIAIRSMMNLCMSFDHRINDGAESSAFMQAMKGRLEAITADYSG